MNKEEKGLIIEELANKLSSTPFFYIADTSGMTVAQINDFRRLCFNKGLDYKVYKNTLIQKAFDKQGITGMEDVLKGTSGILFSPESNNLPAKIIKEYRRSAENKERPVLKGAYIDSDVIVGNDNLDMLVNLKSKAELVGEIIGLLQSPAKNVVSALKSSGGKIAGIVKTLSER